MHQRKIIFSSYDDISNPFYGGGGGRSIHAVASRLASEYDVTVITGNYKGAKNTRIDNIQYKRIGLRSLDPRLAQLFFHVLLPFYAKKEQFDLWIESFTPPYSTSCLQLFTKKPVVGICHMLTAEDMERKYKLPFSILEHQGLKTYKYFIVLTQELKKKVVTHNRKAKLFLIPNGVNQRKNPAKLSSRQKYILYMGRIELNQKGLDLLLAAYKKAASKIDAKLVIAGSGLPREEKLLKKLVKDSGLESKVLLAGNVEGKKKESLFQNSSAIIIPSRFETFGNVALEAMSYGKPLIHFSIEGLRWIPSSCSIRVPAFDTTTLSSAMVKVINDKTVSRKLSLAGQKAVKDYSWDTIVTQYKQMLESILKTHG